MGIRDVLFAARGEILAKIAASAEFSDHPLDIAVDDFRLLAEEYEWDHDPNPLTVDILRFNGFRGVTIMCERGNLQYYEGRGMRLGMAGNLFFLYSTSHDPIGPVETAGDLRRLLSVFKRDGEIIIPAKEESTNA